MKPIIFSKLASKQLQKAPRHIANKVKGWVNAVRSVGVETLRLKKGLHDEPLKGTRQGQRSVRLNQQWRLIYLENLEIIARSLWKRFQKDGITRHEERKTAVYKKVHEDLSTTVTKLARLMELFPKASIEEVTPHDYRTR